MDYLSHPWIIYSKYIYFIQQIAFVLVHGLGTEVLHPPPPPRMTLQEWYNFVQGNYTNQNRGVPIDLFGMYFAIWAIFKMAAFENDENNKLSK